MNTSFYLPIFEALGHETRFKVFAFIYQSGKAGVRPKEMIEQFGFDSGTLDFHLKKLVAVKLIVLKVGSRRGVYSVDEDIPQELTRLFDSSHAGKALLMYSSAPLAPSNLEPLH